METKTILGVIDAALESGKTMFTKVDQKLSMLSRAEKVLIGLCWLIVTLCVIFPGLFWTATGLSIAAFAIRLFYHKKSPVIVVENDTPEEAE